MVRPESEKGLGLATFPGSPTLVFPYLSGDRVMSILDAYGRKGRPGLEAYLYPELFALFAVSFFLLFSLSFLLRVSNAASTRFNLLPIVGFLSALAETALLLVLIASYPAKDTRGFLLPMISGLHSLKIASYAITAGLIILAFIMGFTLVLEEFGIQGAKPSKPTATLSQGAQAEKEADGKTPKRKQVRRAN